MRRRAAARQRGRLQASDRTSCSGVRATLRRRAPSPLSIQKVQHALEGLRIKVGVDVNLPPPPEINHDRATILLARSKTDGLVRNRRSSSGCRSPSCASSPRQLSPGGRFPVPTGNWRKMYAGSPAPPRFSCWVRLNPPAQVP